MISLVERSNYRDARVRARALFATVTRARWHCLKTSEDPLRETSEREFELLPPHSYSTRVKSGAIRNSHKQTLKKLDRLWKILTPEKDSREDIIPILKFQNKENRRSKVHNLVESREKTNRIESNRIGRDIINEDITRVPPSVFANWQCCCCRRHFGSAS